MAQSTRDAEQVMTDYAALWNGDRSKMDVVAADATIHDPVAPGGVLDGREAFEAYLREFRDAFPDASFTIDAMLAEDDLAMVEWTMTGTHEGEFAGVSPTGEAIEITGMSRTLIRDGAVVEDHICVDRRELFERLGATAD